MKKIEYKSITTDNVNKVIKLREKLYEQYESVKLINSPLFSESGKYTFECINP